MNEVGKKTTQCLSEVLFLQEPPEQLQFSLLSNSGGTRVISWAPNYLQNP